MALDTDAVETVTFDSYSTLVDVDAAARVLEGLEGLVGEPAAVAAEWRRRAVEYSVVANDIDAYQTYYECHRDGLEYALRLHGHDPSGEELDELNAVYHDLEPFDDVRPGIERLVEAGYDCHVLSNGDPAMLDSLVETTDLGDLLGETVSADEIRTFKPARELYEHAAERVGTPVGGIAHASAGGFDVQGAIHAGMQGVWLDRKGTPWEPFDGDPDLVVETVHELADALV